MEMRWRRMALGKVGKLGSVHHGAVVSSSARQERRPAADRRAGTVDEASVWPERIRRRRPSRSAETRGRGARIGRAAIAVGERAHGIGAFLGGNSGGQAVADVHRNGERGAERRIVERHHRIEMQPAGLLRRQRRADDARGVADNERHLFRRAQARCDKQIALVFAVVVIGDDDSSPRAKAAMASLTC